MSTKSRYPRSARPPISPVTQIAVMLPRQTMIPPKIVTQPNQKRFQPCCSKKPPSSQTSCPRLKLRNRTRRDTSWGILEGAPQAWDVRPFRTSRPRHDAWPLRHGPFDQAQSRFKDGLPRCLRSRDGVVFLRFLNGFLSDWLRNVRRMGVPGISKSSRNPLIR